MSRNFLFFFYCHYTHPPLHRFDNPASVAPPPQRQLTYNYLVSVNLWLLLFPDALVCDWTMNSIELIKGFGDPRNLLTILSYAIIALMSYIAISTENRRKANVLIMVSIAHGISIKFELISHQQSTFCRRIMQAANLRIHAVAMHLMLILWLNSKLICLNINLQTNAGSLIYGTTIFASE